MFCYVASLGFFHLYITVLSPCCIMIHAAHNSIDARGMAVLWIFVQHLRLVCLFQFERCLCCHRESLRSFRLYISMECATWMGLLHLMTDWAVSLGRRQTIKRYVSMRGMTVSLAASCISAKFRYCRHRLRSFEIYSQACRIEFIYSASPVHKNVMVSLWMSAAEHLCK